MKFWWKLWQQGRRIKLAVSVAIFLPIVVWFVPVTAWEHGAANGLFGQREFADVEVGRVEVRKRHRSTSYWIFGSHGSQEIKVTLWSDDFATIKPGDVVAVVVLPGRTDAFLNRGIVVYNPDIALWFTVLLAIAGALGLIALVVRYFDRPPRFARNKDFIDNSVMRRIDER